MGTVRSVIDLVEAKPFLQASRLPGVNCVAEHIVLECRAGCHSEVSKFLGVNSITEDTEFRDHRYIGGLDQASI